MKNKFKLFGLIFFIVAIVFFMIACDNGSTGDDNSNVNDGNGNNIIGELSGTMWSGLEGLATLEFTGNKYEVYVLGILDDAGTYAINGNWIMVSPTFSGGNPDNALGNLEIVDKNTLKSHDKDGIFTWTRM